MKMNVHMKVHKSTNNPFKEFILNHSLDIFSIDDDVFLLVWCVLVFELKNSNEYSESTENYIA